MFDMKDNRIEASACHLSACDAKYTSICHCQRKAGATFTYLIATMAAAVDFCVYSKYIRISAMTFCVMVAY